MRRLSLSLAIALLVAVTLSSVAVAQVKPEFKLGFKTLADQIPDMVGEPTENENWGPNGDSLQHTTVGLMAWRKSDNWTAFTNGYWTWVNGPAGVQKRLNTERFPWENDNPAPSTAAPAPPAQAAPAPTATPQAAPAPAAAPAAAKSYVADVKAMDTQSAGPGVTVKTLMAATNEEWAAQWGWRPSRPTTIYLYFDGYRMADGIGAVSGTPMTASQRDYYAKNISGVAMNRDVLTGGYAVVLNLGYRYGTPTWEAEIKTVLIHEYTHVMQQDFSGGAGPNWFREGMAELMAYVRVPNSPYLKSRLYWVAQANNAGRLPTLQQLQSNWSAMSNRTPQAADEAYGASYLAVKFLADKVGGMPLRQVLEKTAAGMDFNAALSSVTGYTVDRLQGEYKATLPTY